MVDDGAPVTGGVEQNTSDLTRHEVKQPEHYSVYIKNNSPASESPGSPGGKGLRVDGSDGVPRLLVNDDGVYAYGQLGVSDLKISARSADHERWLKCDGRAVSRTTYATLFSIITTTFGIGDGVSTFNIPNFIDTVPVGAGGLVGVGGAVGSNTSTNLSHNHVVFGHDHGVDSHSHGTNSHSHTVNGHTHDDGSLTIGSHNHGSTSGGSTTTSNIFASSDDDRSYASSGHQHDTGNSSPGVTGNTGSASPGTSGASPSTDSSTVNVQSIGNQATDNQLGTISTIQKSLGINFFIRW
jgi:microcystin-dependent protein